MTASAGTVSFASIRKLVEKSRVRNVTAIHDVLDRIRQNESTIILGPRFSEKTFLLQDIAEALHTQHVAPLLIDLEVLKTGTGPEFIGALATAIAAAHPALCSQTNPPSDERQLQNYLEELPQILQADLVLLFDHLESLPVNNIVVLLRVLRAIITETQGKRPRHSMCAVATSTFTVADISLGPVSPFNVSRPVWMDDLTRDETAKFVEQIARTLQVEIQTGFAEEMYQLTNGDRYAIARLCDECARRAQAAARNTITPEDLAGSTDSFLENAKQYQPFQETRRSLEHDPVSLLALMTILNRAVVLQRDLKIPIDGPDHLRLTGAVQIESTADGALFRPRSSLYRRYLQDYYHPTRVSRVLFVAGCFDDALEYLRQQPTLRTDTRIRAAFLDSVIASIFAARSVDAAVNSLASYIHAAFDCVLVSIYLLTPTRAELVPASHWGVSPHTAPKIRRDSDAMEVQAFNSDHYVIDGEQHRLGIPLRDRDGEPAGVVILSKFASGPRDDTFAELLAFVRRLANALARVLDHERRITQLESLQAISREVASSVDLDQVLKRTVVEGIKAIPGAERGVLVLYDDDDKKLHVREPVGFREGFTEKMIINPDGDSYVARVFKTGEAIVIADAQTDERVTMRDDPDVAQQRSALCVPLAAWGRRIGAFCVDNITTNDAFREVDKGLLSAFAAQAAIAIQNATVYRELYELSLAINDSDLHAEDVFRKAVRSIVRITAATAANMVLLREGKDPASAVADRPQVYAHGLGEDFERTFQPRPDGVTYHVAREGKYVVVPSTAVDLTINPFSAERGVESTIALPLMIGGEVRGALFVNFADIHEFSAEEIHILSLYANECAVAIERVRLEEQRLHDSVAWMGLDLSEIGHDITQAVARLQSNLYMLSQTVKGANAKELVAKARSEAEAIAAVPRRALMPGTEQLERFNILEVVRKEAFRWCKAHPEISLDIAGIAASAQVSGDSRRLGKVVKTIMQNAVRAAKISERPTIRIISEISGRWVNISFANTGKAITADIRDRLFRKPARDPDGGLGVGLLIARAIVFGYAGHLSLTSSDENETVFTLSLPLAMRIPEGEMD